MFLDAKSNKPLSPAQTQWLALLLINQQYATLNCMLSPAQHPATLLYPTSIRCIAACTLESLKPPPHDLVEVLGWEDNEPTDVHRVQMSDANFPRRNNDQRCPFAGRNWVWGDDALAADEFQRHSVQVVEMLSTMKAFPP